jgi:hypothetical protein
MRSARAGQSTVELVLTVPLLFCVLFLVVELAFFFGGTHYANYAAFVGARAQQVGRSAEDAAGLLLDGNVTRLATVDADASGGSVTVRQPWTMDLPFTDIFGTWDYDVTVVAGPNEERYEGRSGILQSMYADNQCRGRC